MSHASAMYDPSEAAAITATWAWGTSLLGLGLYAGTAYMFSILFQVYKRTGWHAWVPGLNAWTFLSIAGMNGRWIALLFLTPIPGIGVIAVLVVFGLLLVAASKVSEQSQRHNPLWIILAAVAPLIWVVAILGGFKVRQGKVQAFQIR